MTRSPEPDIAMGAGGTPRRRRAGTPGTMSQLRWIIALSVASGVFWAAVAVVLGRPMGRLTWGGVILAPFIGLGAGFASAWFPSESRVRRAVFSLASLYLATAVFGLGMGVYDLLTGQNSGTGWRIPSAVVLQAAMAALWGLTFTGYVIVLWPLSYANHLMLSRAWAQREPTREA